MATEDNGNNEMTLLMTSINQSILSLPGCAFWLDTHERPVILKGKPLLVKEIKDGKAWIHITFGNNLGMRTETDDHRKQLIAWAYKTEEAFSQKRECLGLIGPGKARFLRTVGDFSGFLLPQQAQAIPRHRRTVAYG